MKMDAISKHAHKSIHGKESVYQALRDIVKVANKIDMLNYGSSRVFIGTLAFDAMAEIDRESREAADLLLSRKEICQGCCNKKCELRN